MIWKYVNHMLISLNGGPVEKKIIRCSFSPSLLEERALSQLNIGIKYDVLLHAFPQLHHFLRDIWYDVYPHAPLSTIKWEWIKYEQK